MDARMHKAPEDGKQENSGASCAHPTPKLFDVWQDAPIRLYEVDYDACARRILPRRDLVFERMHGFNGECHFCGDLNRLRVLATWHGVSNQYHVYCCSCCCRGPAAFSPESAVELWIYGLGPGRGNGVVNPTVSSPTRSNRK